MATIGVVHLPEPGHVGPANRLTGVLAAGGHRLVAWAPEGFREAIEASGAEHRPFDLPPVIRRRFSREPAEPAHLRVPWVEGDPPLMAVDRLHRMALLLAQATAALTETIAEDLGRCGVDLVIHDSMATWGRVAADSLKLPRVACCILFPPPFETTGEPPLTETVEEGLAAARDTVTRRFGLDLGGSWDIMQSFASRNLSFTTPRIAGQAPKDGTWTMVGPLLGGEEARAAGSGSRSPSETPPEVFVTLGTRQSWRAEMYRAVIDGLADEDVRVTVTTGGRLRSAEFDPLPENVVVERWVDASAALSRATLVMNHGGANSVHEAMLAAVPMVCLPQADDQQLWAHRVRSLGLGRALYSPDPATVRDAVGELISDAGVRRRAREVSEHLRGYEGDRLASQAVESLLP